MMKGTIRQAALLILAGLLAAPAMATNGMYLSSYGPETLGRGGANLAVSDRALALNFNPAGIAQLQGNHFTTNLAILAPQLEYKNMFNERLEGEDNYFPLPSFSWVHGSKASDWTWGVGFIAQGGMGAEFHDTVTPFGAMGAEPTRDMTFSEVRFATISPTVAYSFTEDMAVGITANVGWADASFRLWPETSFYNEAAPEASFFGANMKKAQGLVLSARVGWWWRPHPKFTLGLVYQTETDSDYEDGDLWVNFTNHPLAADTVKYDAQMDGFEFAAQAGVGFSVRPHDDWVLALDIKRYFWDDAINTIAVTGTDPDSPMAPPELTLPFVFDWEDQWVFAVGADWRASDAWTVRFGYNYGENPVPDETLNPLFPANVGHHVNFGFSYLRNNVTWSFGVEHALQRRQTNDNIDPMVNPFGPGSSVDHSQWTVAFGAGWVLD